MLFTKTELLVLRDFAHERKLPGPNNVGRAVRTMAVLVGYLNRTVDAPPGNQKLWEGLSDLRAAARVYERVLRLQQQRLLARALAAQPCEGGMVGRQTTAQRKTRTMVPAPSSSTLWTQLEHRAPRRGARPPVLRAGCNCRRASPNRAAPPPANPPPRRLEAPPTPSPGTRPDAEMTLLVGTLARQEDVTSA